MPVARHGGGERVVQCPPMLTTSDPLPHPLLHDGVVAAVVRLCADATLDFPARCARLEAAIRACTRDQIIEHLQHGGVISECIGHDSSEEKLLAKYSDVLLACALGELGFQARVLAERSDAADVYAECGDQRIVGDGKIFRLSRTALNPKDYKVPSLKKWRQGAGYSADYSVLLAPSFQYPLSRSQLYAQAIDNNVLLLSFEQLAFLVRHHQPGRDYRPLWEYAGTRAGQDTAAWKEARQYWHGLNQLVARLAGQTEQALRDSYAARRQLLQRQFDDEIAHWDAEAQRIRGLSREQAIAELLVSKKIQARVDLMRGAQRQLTLQLDDARA
ncbi:HindIII family type II restriction endonuclease [Bordetella bronchiseptica]|uniref:HindIII family type II restriction endonuclease n=1 Tax=Bordetella bronchiseptica TaxID=518 RepID=UPI0005292FD8|nr:HindIII family type II restriction endonuclease [Bordetella bronchiseptica]